MDWYNFSFALQGFFVGIIFLLVLYIIHQVWKISQKPKHRHSWKVVSVTNYKSYFGPRTVLSYVCKDCGNPTASNIDGTFSLEDFEG